MCNLHDSIERINLEVKRERERTNWCWWPQEIPKNGNRNGPLYDIIRFVGIELIHVVNLTGFYSTAPNPPPPFNSQHHHIHLHILVINKTAFFFNIFSLRPYDSVLIRVFQTQFLHIYSIIYVVVDSFGYEVKWCMLFVCGCVGGCMCCMGFVSVSYNRVPFPVPFSILILSHFVSIFFPLPFSNNRQLFFLISFIFFKFFFCLCHRMCMCALSKWEKNQQQRQQKKKKLFDFFSLYCTYVCVCVSRVFGVYLCLSVYAICGYVNAMNTCIKICA